MDINQIKENKLKFILQFSIPSIISMLLQTAITITDAFFTGNYVGENALAAINLGLPILYFFLGIGPAKISKIGLPIDFINIFAIKF